VGTKVDSKRIAAGLRADMLSSAVSPIFGTFTQSAFAQNVGLVAITGVKSRFVVTAGGGVLVILGLLPVLGRVVGAIPSPVLGGAGLVLFGSVAASGIRTLAKVEYKDNMNLVIVATSLAVGMLPIAVRTIYAQMPAWFVTIFHRHQLGRGHRDPAEPAVQPPRQRQAQERLRLGADAQHPGRVPGRLRGRRLDHRRQDRRPRRQRGRRRAPGALSRTLRLSSRARRQGRGGCSYRGTACTPVL
jgi:hypothetical protein